ncbi:Ig-like domain-containing protein, partial [Rahnella bruchi]|uniref:Ig-like domain-containing protein n=1 Tax=Rahnella bruchi TaxID=1510573 RepID=UPI001FC9758C
EVGKDGTWSYQFTGKQALQKGDNVFHVTASDSVDHMATGSDFVVTLTGSNQDDTTAPDAPVITDVVDDYGLTTGSVANGGKTDDALLKISGTAEAGSTVVITHVVESTGATYIDGSVVADASGHWVFDMTGPFQPTFGNRIITATATDAAGNVSEVSDSYVVNFVAPNQDALIVPDAPVITDITDDVGSQKGPVANGGKTDDRTPTLHGTAEAGSVVTIYVDRAGNGKHSTLGSVTADSTGHWTWTSQKIGLFDSTYTYTAMATDAQGVKSAISNGYAIELVHSNQDDTTAPDAPGIAFAQETYDDGTHQGVNNGATIDDATPQLVGAAEPDSIVKVYDGATLIGSVVADAKGAWAFDVPQALADGKHTFTVTATDAAGNTSAHSDNFVLDVETADITPPDAPVITEVYDDVGLTQGPVENGGKTDDDQLKISGTAEANSTVIISHVVEATGNTYVDGSVVADASGHWVFQMEDALQPTFGNRIITATATDAAGNVSAASDGYTVNYVGTNLDDITVPDAPIIDLVEHGEFSIPTPVSNGGIINKDINLMAGDAEPGSLVTIYDGDVVITTCTTDSDGRWTAAYLEVSSEGTHTLTATATDAAGNVSAHTADFVVNVVTSVSGFEDFEQFGDSLLDINSLVTDSGLKIESTKDQDNFNIAGISGADQKDVNHLFNEYNLGLVKFTLPGVADKVSFFGYDIAGNANVHAYDANGNEIAISITYREPTAAEVNALVVIADAYTITPASGQHIASFTVEGYQWIDDISWTSAGAAHATTQSALLTSPDAVDHHDIMTLAQVDDSHKSTAAVDITDHVQNTLHLTLNDILSGAHANLFIQDGHKQLAITGDQGDVVELKVEDLAHNTWQDAGQVTSGGIQYEVYQHTGGDVE